MGPLTWACVVLLAMAFLMLAAFGLVDYFAHVTHYQHGQTFSALMWWLEERSAIARAVVATFCLMMSAGGVALFLHLSLHLF